MPGLGERACLLGSGTGSADICWADFARASVDAVEAHGATGGLQRHSRPADCLMLQGASVSVSPAPFRCPLTLMGLSGCARSLAARWLLPWVALARAGLDIPQRCRQQSSGARKLCSSTSATRQRVISFGRTSAQPGKWQLLCWLVSKLLQRTSIALWLPMQCARQSDANAACHPFCPKICLCEQTVKTCLSSLCQACTKQRTGCVRLLLL